MYNKLFKICVFAFVSGAAICLYLVQRDRVKEASYDNESPLTRVDNTKDVRKETDSNVLADDVMSRHKAVTAYVCGEVVKPGVYELPYGSRLDEYIKAAGGFTENALTTSENLARVVNDGEKIYIPKLMDDADNSGNGDKALDKDGIDHSSESEPSKENGLVNINNASEEQLTSLAGIGRSKAKSIVEYRRLNGGFSRIEDIMKVDGIKESVYNKIKDNITV